MSRLTLALATMLSFMAFTPVSAQDFQKGVAAYNAGDYTTALQEWPPLAEQGLAEAQSSHLVLYEIGKGVPQDNVMAHMWYKLAAANGFEKAGEWRDERAGLMTNSDISKAQATAREDN